MLWRHSLASKSRDPVIFVLGKRLSSSVGVSIICGIDEAAATKRRS